jgi:long-chain fatty acid transport protein
MKKISINPNYPAFGATYTGGMVLASDFFTDGANTLNGLATGATSYSGLLTAKIGGGISAATLLTDAPTNGLTPTQIGTIQAIITAAGQSVTGINIGTAQAILAGSAPVFTAKASGLAGYATKTQDLLVDAEQTGMAFTPILSVNYSPAENLNIAIKYEFQTALNLKTNIIDGKDGRGIYIQDSSSVADLPAIIFAGVEYRPIKNLMLSGTFNYYFDKKVDYDGQKDVVLNKIDKNFIEFGLGAEYGISEKLRISGGWLHTITGVNSNYQSDLTYSTNTNSFGAGIGYRINEMIDLNLGGQYTFYEEGSKTFTRITDITETYNKKTWVIGAGIDLYFGKSK